jgi:hypothetical protein
LPRLGFFSPEGAAVAVLPSEQEGEKNLLAVSKKLYIYPGRRNLFAVK